MKRIIGLILICVFSVMLLPFSYVSADNSTSGEWWKTYEPAENAFDYYVDGDPMTITDEEFFGVWDNENYMWSSEPYFSYDLYPGLTAVKEAAMDGDYDLAKEELQAYYSSVREDRVNDVTSYPGSRAALTAYLLSKNAYAVDTGGCGVTMGIVKFNNNWNTYRTPVSLSSSIVGIKQYIGYGFFAIDKFPTQGEIKSRESGSAPKLEIVMNGGVAVTLDACADGTVRGGIYEDTNYGFEDTLKIQSAGTWRKFTEDTHYAYVKFDISFLKETDKVESATLVYEGRNGSGTGEKEIVVYMPALADWNEDNLNFNTYSVNVQFWTDHDKNVWDWVLPYSTKIKGSSCLYYRGQTLHEVAALYSYSKNEEHAFTFIRQQMAYVNKIGLNHECQNALDVSVFLPQQVQDVYYVIDSQHMTPEIFTAMLKDMWIKAEYLCNDYFFGKSNNWGGFAASGVYNVIAYFPEFAVFDEWLQRTKEQYTYLLDAFTFDDGMCLEHPLGYVGTLLGTVETPVAISAKLGVEVPFEDGVLKSIHGSVQTLIYCSGPNYSGTNIGDAGSLQSGALPHVKIWYESVFTDDAEFEYAVTGGVSGALPKNPTTHYPVGLRTYMRSAWGDDNAFVMAITGKGVGSHRDNDVLSLCMFAYGQFLLTDQGYATKANFTSDSKGYFGHAARHNLVTINGKDHDYGTRDATELAFESNMMYDFIEYSGQNYVKARQQRSVLYLKDQKFWIVTDFEEPVDKDEIIVYEQLWHMLPEANMTVDPETLEARSHMEQSANVIVRPVDIYDATVSIEDSHFVRASETYEDSKKAVIKKEVSGDTKYSTIIFPVDVNDDYSVNATPIDIDGDKENINAFVATITNELTGDYDNYYYCHHNISQGRQPVTLGTYETDASTVLIQEDNNGDVVSVFLMDATYLKDNSLDNDKDLFVSNTPVKAIGYRFAGKTIQIQSSDIINSSDLEEMTIFVGDKNNVLLNDEEINANKSGGYAYFADSPIVEGSKPPVHTDDTPSKAPHGTGGGGGGGGSAPIAKPTPDDDKETIDDKNGENQFVAPPAPTDTVPSNIVKELEGHWGEKEITSLYKAGIVTGDSNGLRLKDSISRAEFVALVVRALKLENSNYKNTFLDVDSKDWHAPYIAAAYDMGLVGGSDGMFRPDDTITREEMCKIIACTIDNEFELKQVGFKDTDSISPWAMEYVNKVYSLGIVKGMDDGTFAPKNNALREQAFIILSRLGNLLNN